MASESNNNPDSFNPVIVYEELKQTPWVKVVEETLVVGLIVFVSLHDLPREDGLLYVEVPDEDLLGLSDEEQARLKSLEGYRTWTLKDHYTLAIWQLIEQSAKHHFNRLNFPETIVQSAKAFWRSWNKEMGDKFQDVVYLEPASKRQKVISKNQGSKELQKLGNGHSPPRIDSPNSKPSIPECDSEPLPEVSKDRMCTVLEGDLCSTQEFIKQLQAQKESVEQEQKNHEESIAQNEALITAKTVEIEVQETHLTALRAEKEAAISDREAIMAKQQQSKTDQQRISKEIEKAKEQELVKTHILRGYEQRD